MAKRSARGPTQRQLQVGELVRHAIAEILRRGELSGLDLAGTVVATLRSGLIRTSETVYTRVSDGAVVAVTRGTGISY